MRNTIYAILLLALAGSCGQNESSAPIGKELAAKTDELAKLKNEQAGLAKKIAALEAEIIKLDPSRAVQPKLVSVAEIAPEGFEAYINLQGRISSENISYVAPRNGVGGYVKELLISEGQYVKRGQLILKLDDQVLRQSIASSRTQLAFAQDLYNRTKSLWDQKIGSEVQLLNAKNNVDGLKNQIAIQEEQLSTYLVYADQSGIAEIVNIKPGELFTGMGATGPQIQIVNNNDLSVEVDIPENYAADTKVGNEVLVEVPAVNKTFKTTISRISESVNAASVGFTAICKIPSSAGLKPNMSASVKILRHSNARAIVIPVNIVQSDEKGKYVYLMDEEGSQKTAKKVSVTLGELYGGQIEILSGLQAGDKLVTKGYQDLYDGQVVNNL
ncbi:MAG: efflux RND transporter periplasmic adaptor subunit [Phaeodactylibacter sp.]|nr:efflux RND transporter periplasmic adaptor subunit [Phaeodactylibacter sp.]MCB9049074.1 efflux RND transporter periplasmic adaptor subunit [Lewinellaceae bacterium]